MQVTDSRGFLVAQGVVETTAAHLSVLWIHTEACERVLVDVREYWVEHCDD